VVDTVRRFGSKPHTRGKRLTAKWNTGSDAPFGSPSRRSSDTDLRAAEVVDLRWEQVDFKTASLHVRRVKNGTPSTHPLTGRELRALRQHQRESAKSPFVFVSERGAPLSAPGFSRMIERAAVVADLGIKAHAHMLRHACGYKLANDGIDTRALQVYLGHRNIQNTTRYTALAPDRFKGFWRD
jgi:integrase